MLPNLENEVRIETVNWFLYQKIENVGYYAIKY